MTLDATRHESLLKSVRMQLLLLLLLMVASYFTWSEQEFIARAFKAGGRMAALAGSLFVYQRVRRYGLPASVKMDNGLATALYLGYLLLGMASFTWTSDLSVSVRQWLMVSQSFAFAYFFVRTITLLDVHVPDHGIRLEQLLGSVAFWLVAVFLVGMWYDPETFIRLTRGGEQARLGGTLMNPNELGMLAVVGMACLAFNLHAGHHLFRTSLQMFLLIVALLATGSRSSMAGAVLIGVFHLIHSKSLQQRSLMAAAVVTVACGMVYFAFISEGDEAQLEEFKSLTGRLPFWKALLTEGMPREPLLGYGFMRIDYDDYFQSVHTYPGKMTHNTFLQVLLNLGFVGLVLALFQLLFTLRGVLRAERRKRLILIGLFIPIFINSLTEFGIFGESNYGILFYQLLLISVAFQPRKYLTSAERMSLKLARARAA